METGHSHHQLARQQRLQGGVEGQGRDNTSDAIRNTKTITIDGHVQGSRFGLLRPLSAMAARAEKFEKFWVLVLFSGRLKVYEYSGASHYGFACSSCGSCSVHV
ncbi:hypothetical protein HRR83_001000 [Exophiala dermatitidis]|nr:hypothetical protein HRR74_001004 [Exophiala dermatitidis]KAJ4527244.1 hypothetical protein HRR73_002041 [Exophiala dermatitidis]KAJ4532971.1 hypothetical protein HRR76_007942 [Exophiala dermatitidis]KAJ4538758.1 hypothetical protein HRR77_006689 [Exophiala dermatitidis]KAJ4574120.1 hypothetical protein HRR79_003115 [Exophiala dermatitidis]